MNGATGLDVLAAVVQAQAALGSEPIPIRFNALCFDPYGNPYPESSIAWRAQHEWEESLRPSMAAVLDYIDSDWEVRFGNNVEVAWDYYGGRLRDEAEAELWLTAKLDARAAPDDL